MDKIFYVYTVGALMCIPPWGIITDSSLGTIIQLVGLAIMITAIIIRDAVKKT